MAADPASDSSRRPATEPKLGFLETLRTFPRSFWMGCGVEMWERLAYYCVMTRKINSGLLLINTDFDLYRAQIFRIQMDFCRAHVLRR